MTAGHSELQRFTATRVVLTPRQQQVLVLLCVGSSNRQISCQLGIAIGTVKVHIAGILRTLHVRNRLEAASTARQLGIDQG